MNESLHDWLCRQIVDRSESGILFADREGVIRLWNQGAEGIFGYRSSEAIGQPLDIIIPERWRERHRIGYQAAMATGRTRYSRDVLAVPAQRKDGTRISIEFTIVLVPDEGDAVLGAAAVVQDVTERWGRDKALKQRLALFEAAASRNVAGRKPSGEPSSAAQEVGDASPRDPEDRIVDPDDPAAKREKMFDKTMADSFPASDPPSSLPDPSEDSFRPASLSAASTEEVRR
jgi:PAS domain S-box-containing protein